MVDARGGANQFGWAERLFQPDDGAQIVGHDRLVITAVIKALGESNAPDF